MLDSGEPAALWGVAFERYPDNAVVGIRPLFDHVEFSSIAPCAAWPVVTERQRDNRVAIFCGTVIDVPDPCQFDKGVTTSVDGKPRRRIPGGLLRKIGMLAPGNPLFGRALGATCQGLDVTKPQLQSQGRPATQWRKTRGDAMH